MPQQTGTEMTDMIKPAFHAMSFEETGKLRRWWAYNLAVAVSNMEETA